MSENLVVPARSAQPARVRDQSRVERDWYSVAVNRNQVTEQSAKADLKWYLMNKYRLLFIDKLSQEDLDELRYYHRRQYDTKLGWDHEYMQKFVMKLRAYMGDDILKREIAGIETLLTIMKPDDLKKDSE